jgi:hypothetical protein
MRLGERYGGSLGSRELRKKKNDDRYISRRPRPYEWE